MGAKFGAKMNALKAAYPTQRRGGTPADFSKSKATPGPAGAAPENDPARITRRR